MRKIIISMLLVVLLFIAFLTSAFGWLSTYAPLPADIDASITTGYFESGDGTEENPYILSNNRHVYNLAWLQYTGYLNNVTNEDGTINQAYFKVKNDIDMKDMVIPPIGTKQYPFVGNFNGNGKAIYNFEVANHLGQGAITERPLSIVNMGEDASIVGFFGVVGDYDGSLGNLIIDDKGREEQVNAVYNLYLYDFIVRTVTAESLIGLLAGYVNGAVENVGIGTSTIQIGGQVAPLSVFPILTNARAISLLSLIGLYDSANVKWDKVPSGSGIGGTSEGGDSGFGGSMNMYDLIRRLTYMYTENIVKPLNNTSLTARYPVSFYISRNTATYANQDRIDYTSTTAKTAHLLEGTVLPLNTSKTTMFADENSYTETGLSIDYLTTAYYADTNHTKEIISEKGNTGYIIGGGNSSGNSMIRMRINKLASGTYPGLRYSIGTATDANAIFDVTKLHCLTTQYDTTSSTWKTYVITDGTNDGASTTVGSTYSKKSYTELGLSQYTTVRDGFADSMTNTDGTGKGMLYGLRFFKGQNLSESIQTTTVQNAEIASIIYPNYEMINGAINFHLESAGAITTLAGTYAEQTGSHDLFSLYKVERDDNGEIIHDTSKTFEIQKIWAKYSGTTITSIKYNQEGSIADGYTCVYDKTDMAMKTLSQINAAYYFELPVVAGDYALTSKDGEKGAYLMYLDIGANGNIVSGTTPGESDYEYAISGVNYVHEDPFAADGTVMTMEGDAYPVVTYRLALKEGTTTHSGIQANFARQSVTELSTTYTNEDNQFEVTGYTDGTGMTYLPSAIANAQYVYQSEEESLI